MGCWNETDMITQFPICAGNNIRLFVIIPQTDKIHLCTNNCIETDNLWAPVGFVKGKYDDYGGIENIEKDFNAEILLENLNTKGNFEGLKKPATLEEYLNEIQENVKSSYDGTSYCKLGYVMILEDVYQTMANYNPIVAHYKEKSYKYVPSNITIKHDIEEKYNNWLKKYSNPGYDIEFFAQYALDFCANEMMKSYYNVLKNYAQNKLLLENEKVKNLIDNITELTLFKYAMMYARKYWAPQSGTGSQIGTMITDLEIYKQLAQTTLNIAKQRIKQSKKDGFELPNKDGYLPYMLEHNEELNK